MKQKSPISDTDAPGGTKTYREYTDDFVESQDQDMTLPDDYVWIHKNILYRAAVAFLYVFVIIFSLVYTKLCLHVKIVGRRKVVKSCRHSGCFLYGNHTQPMGDAFIPTLSFFPKRIYTVIGAANLGIPVLGKCLPILGGLPIPSSLHGMKQFVRAIQHHIEHRRCVVIYPEAHVWPYCTFVRPFPVTSFRYPVDMQVPSYCMTTTYQKRRHGDKPRITVYMDGPFWPRMDLGRRKAQETLHDEVYACMQERSRNSTYGYIRYIRETSV